MMSRILIAFALVAAAACAPSETMPAGAVQQRPALLVRRAARPRFTYCIPDDEGIGCTFEARIYMHRRTSAGVLRGNVSTKTGGNMWALAQEDRGVSRPALSGGDGRLLIGDGRYLLIGGRAGDGSSWVRRGERGHTISVWVACPMPNSVTNTPEH